MKETDTDVWECLVKPQKRVKLNTVINFDDVIEAKCINILKDGLTHFKMNYEGVFLEVLGKVGEVPLPPYIKKN